MHPDEETLLALATGEADLPQRALLEGHLGVCAGCRATVGELAAAGGALLRAAEGEPPPPPLWDRVLAQVEALGTPPTRPTPSAVPAVPLRPRGKRSELPLPDAIRRELADPGARHPPRWHWGFAAGIWYADLAHDPATGSVLLGGYLPPGRSFPEHLHLGPETVLVLSGGYFDHLGRYEAGEYAVYAPGTSHRPSTERDEGCWSLLRLEKPNLLVGWRGSLQRLRR